MNKAELDKVDPAMEMENLEDAVTEMSEVASNLDYWSGLLVQVTSPRPPLTSIEIFLS